MSRGRKPGTVFITKTPLNLDKGFYCISNETIAHCIYALQSHMLNDSATRRNESVERAYNLLRNELMQQGEVQGKATQEVARCSNGILCGECRE